MEWNLKKPLGKEKHLRNTNFLGEMLAFFHQVVQSDALIARQFGAMALW